MNGALPSQPKQIEIYCVFAGSIDQEALKRIFYNLTIATNPTTNVSHLHLLFQSTGGFVGDGVALYNFFHTFPIDLTLYNVGAVQSIATIAYLGAKRRKASAHATFMIHRSYNFPQAATATRLEAATKAIKLDDGRTEGILRQHIKLSDAHWKNLDYNDLLFSAAEAVAAGIATEIAEFSPPKGTQVYNI